MPLLPPRRFVRAPPPPDLTVRRSCPILQPQTTFLVLICLFAAVLPLISYRADNKFYSYYLPLFRMPRRLPCLPVRLDVLPYISTATLFAIHPWVIAILFFTT